MNLQIREPLSRKARIQAGREALADLFPDMIEAHPEAAMPAPGAKRRAEMRSWDIPDPTPEPVLVADQEVEAEPENPDLPDPVPGPAPALDEKALGNLALNTGEQAIGALSDLFPSMGEDPEPDAEVADPFGPSRALSPADPEDAGKRMLKEMRLSFQALFGLGGKSAPDHKARLEPEPIESVGEVPNIRETEVFVRPEDDPDLPRLSM